MSESLRDRLKGVFAEVFETEPDAISDEMSTDNTASWDSMQSIVLASSVEGEFEVELTDVELVTLNSFTSILSALASRKELSNA